MISLGRLQASCLTWRTQELRKEGLANLQNAILVLHCTGRRSAVGRDKLRRRVQSFADGAAVEEEKVASARTFRDNVLLLENRKSGGAHNAEIQPPRVVWRGDGGESLVACMNFCLRDNLKAATLARDLASGSLLLCLA